MRKLFICSRLLRVAKRPASPPALKWAPTEPHVLAGPGVRRHRPWFRISAVVWARPAETTEHPRRARFSQKNGQLVPLRIGEE
jgi:hypothetical protein